MAINDYVPKFDGISEFVPQMYQAINETARNTGQIRKATADTTAQGWAALQKAFTDFGEQNLQSRGLDLKAKELAGNEAYRSGQLGQQREAEFGAEGRAKGARELEWAKMEQQRKLAEMEDKTNRAAIGARGKDKEQDKARQLRVYISEAAGLTGDKSMITTGDNGEPYIDRAKFRAAYPTEDAAIQAFTSTLIPVKDPADKDAYIQAFRQWYKSGAPLDQSGQGNAAPVSVRPSPNVNQDKQAAAVQAEIDRTKVPFGATPAEKRQIQEKLDGLAARLKELQPRASVSAFD